MKPVGFTFVATHYGTHGDHGVQVMRVWSDGEVTAQISCISFGPRGGVKVVEVNLTDAQRLELIEALGGTVISDEEG